MKYGELDLNRLLELGVDFAHYTPRRGRSKREYTMWEMPKKFWRDGNILKNPASYVYITDNNGLKIAPTSGHEIEYPITLSYKIPVELADKVFDELESQGLKIPDTLPDSNEASITLDGEGNYYLAESVEELVEESQPQVDATQEDVVQQVVPAKAKRVGVRRLLTKEAMDEMFGLQFGDLIRVYDREGKEVQGDYIYVMSFSCVPRLKNAKTEREIDLYFLMDHAYEVISSAQR